MKKIIIKKSSTADTRTCDVSTVSKENLMESSLQHIGDVQSAIEFITSVMKQRAVRHDYDKILDIDTFHADFKTKFEQHSWWDNHKIVSKHHLNENCIEYDKLDLLDILEHIVDCCMAGLGRSGSVYQIIIDPALIQKAVDNTVRLIVENTEVIE